jgi:hypothetical protein
MTRRLMTTGEASKPPRAKSAADHWREAYERTARQLEIVLELQLRAAGPQAQPKAPHAPEDVESLALQRAEERAIERAKKAEREFVQRATTDFITNKGMDPVAAEREAKLLWQAATDFHPAGG